MSKATGVKYEGRIPGPTQTLSSGKETLSEVQSFRREEGGGGGQPGTGQEIAKCDSTGKNMSGTHICRKAKSAGH